MMRKSTAGLVVAIAFLSIISAGLAASTPRETETTSTTTITKTETKEAVTTTEISTITKLASFLPTVTTVTTTATTTTTETPQVWQVSDGPTKTTTTIITAAPTSTTTVTLTTVTILTLNTDSTSETATTTTTAPTTFTTTSSTTTMTQTNTGPKLVINEVELNPPGNDGGNEWIELYNPNPFAVDIRGYTLLTGSGVSVNLPCGTVIGANRFCLVDKVLGYHVMWLSNEGESIILRNASGFEIDRTLLLTDTADDDRTWQRIPNGVDTDTESDWQFTAATKGSISSSSP